MQINIKLFEGGRFPEYKTEGSVGADCYARLIDEVVIPAGQMMRIPLGFAIEIPKGYEMQIRPRSGLSCLGIIGIIGTIDSDYRGEVCAIIFNSTNESYKIKNQDRVAQAVITSVEKVNWHLVNQLSETERGSGGFGSTGKTDAKYYEPFRDVEDAKIYLNKRVQVGVFPLDGTITKIDWKDYGYTKTGYIEIQLDEGQLYNDAEKVEFLFTTAFELVKVDGHLFGKEIKL